MKTHNTVYSLYWNNINPEIIVNQKRVFETFNCTLVQQNIDKQDHGKWMQELVAKVNIHDVIVFADIDCIPLKKDAISHATRVAEAGGIFGLAQTSNHLNNPRHIYASPVFFAIKKSTWLNMGCPCFEANADNDVAQGLTKAAEEYGIKVKLAYPTSALIPKWPLADRGIYGIGTFYHSSYFHLFESRGSNYESLFTAVAGDVLARKSLDFDKYLRIAKTCSNNRMESTKTSIQARITQKILGLNSKHN